VVVALGLLVTLLEQDPLPRGWPVYPLFVSAGFIPSGLVLWRAARRAYRLVPAEEGAEAAALRACLPALGAVPPLTEEAYPVEPSGIPVGAETRLEEGTRILANWMGVWWRAEVRALEPGDRVRIRYLGWEDYWPDEIVPRSVLLVDRGIPVSSQ
jgi:hypothetical protein